MRFCTHLGWSFVCCALVGGCSGDASVKEAAALEGEWNWVAIEDGGITSSPNEIMGQKWSIKGNEISATIPGVATHKMAFKLNASKTPKEMDLMPLYDPYKGAVHPTIYELESGKLRVCCTDPNEKVRPTDFTAGAMIFEKVTR